MVEHDSDKLVTRSFDIEIREDGKLTGIASTETPVPMWDYTQRKYIPEILLMSGATLPEGGRVPLLDSHNRNSVKDQLGSARLYVEGNRLMAEPEISSAHPDVQKMVDEKHLRGLSIGYRVDDPHFIPQNKSEVHEGRTYEGPVNLVKRFTVRELSLTPIQADPNAFLRKEENSDHATIDKETPTVGESQERMDNENKTQENTTPEETRAVETRAVDTDQINKLVQERIEAERKLGREIRTECKRHGLNDYADEIIDTCKTRAEANARILDLLAETQKKVAPVTLTAGRSHHEKTVDALKTGLEYRYLGKAKFERVVPADQRGMGWETTRNLSLLDVARECLELQGENTALMSKDTIAKRALLDGARADTGDLAYLTTGNFPSLLLNVLNKELLEAYVEAAPTFRQVFRMGPPAKDFKTLYRMRSSAVGNLDMWPEGAKVNEGILTDKKETFSVDRYGKAISIGYQTIVNDDLSAFQRVPAQMAQACLRGQNILAWSLVTANGNLSDGNAFFSSAHNNVVSSSGGAPSDISQLSSMYKLFREQKGMASELLNPTPRYLVVPPALETAAKQIVRSQYDPSANKFQVFNPFSSEESQLTVIVEPLLAANSEVMWYLFGGDQEAIGEFVYLEGQESPYMSSWIDMETKSHKFVVEQSWGAALIDYQYGARNVGQ